MNGQPAVPPAMYAQISALPPAQQQQILAKMQQGQAQMPQAQTGGQQLLQTPQGVEAAARAAQSSPEMMGDLTRDYEGRGVMADAAMTKADALRDTATPEGRTTRNDIYQAANPLEHLATGVSRYQGMKGQNAAQSKMDALSAGKERGLGGIFSNFKF